MTHEPRSRRPPPVLLAVASLPVLPDLAFGPFRIVRTDGGEECDAVETVSLPAPSGESDVSVEEAIADRRSRREYGDGPLERRELGQLLWATQGVTDRRTGFRAAPSAGSLFPLEVYVVAGPPGVEGLDSGIYRYCPGRHELALETGGDVRPELRAATLDQEYVGEAPVDIVLCAVDDRTVQLYGERGRERYVPMEAGHAGENLYLQAESLDLATVSIGAFDDGRVRDVVGVPASQRPLYIFPVGRRRR
jgi:SagB-type dehydrogenase family enzyme